MCLLPVTLQRLVSMATGSELDVESVLAVPGVGIASCQPLPPTSAGIQAHVLEQHAQRPQFWTRKAILPFVVLAFVQFLTATYQTLSKVALTSGIDPFLYTFYRNVMALVILAPFAFHLERDVRPKLTLHTFGRVNLLAFLAIVGNQLFFLAGLALTSAIFTGVALNMIPAITFVCATLSGIEKVSFRKTSDLVTMLGTVVCITGGVTMTLYKGMALYHQPTGQAELYHHGFQHLQLIGFNLHLAETGHWALGVACLFLNCTAWGLYLIYQGSVLEQYPALLSMVTLIEFFGCIQVAILGAAYGSPFLDLRSITMDQLTIILYAGIFVSAANLVLQGWCVGQVGPLIVSLFSPLQTVLVTFEAILMLGETLYTGILMGATLIIGGFYIVIYGKQLARRRSESALTSSSNPTGVGDTNQSDLQEPLLPRDSNNRPC